MARNKSEKELAAEPWDGVIPLRHMLTAKRPPSLRDDDHEDYSVGSVWVNTATDNAYVCTDISTNHAEWALISTGSK